MSIEQAEGRGELRGLGEVVVRSLKLGEVRLGPGDGSLGRWTSRLDSWLSLETSWEHSELVRFAGCLPEDGGGGAARFLDDRMEESESLLPFIEDNESRLP